MSAKRLGPRARAHRIVALPHALRRLAFVLIAGTAAAAFAARAQTSAPDPLDPGLNTPHYGKWGFDAAGEDRTVKPGDDFFTYANGNYVKALTIPADRSRYGSFDLLSTLSENRVRAILEDAAASGAPVTTPKGKVGAFYEAFMDEPRVEALGAAPLVADLARVKAARTHDEIAALMGDHSGFADSIFGASVQPDAKNPGVYALNIGTGGLGLPDKDYYLKPSFAAKKAAYQTYIADMLKLAQWPDAEANAAAIVALETKMAQASWERADRRDRDKTYNPMSTAELATYAPGFDFKRFFAASGVGSADLVILSDNTAFPKKAAIFAQTPVPVLQAWLAFNEADNAAPYLSKAFADRNFEFRSKTLNGQPQQRPRWKRGVAAINGALGEAVGEVYVARYFTPEAKAQMLALVGNIKGRAGGAHPDARLDGTGDQGAGAPETLAVHGQDRLSRRVARLRGAECQPDRPLRRR